MKLNSGDAGSTQDSEKKEVKDYEETKLGNSKQRSNC